MAQNLKEKLIEESTQENKRTGITTFAIMAGAVIDVMTGEPSNYHLKYAIAGSIIPQIPYLYNELKEKKITFDSLLYSAFLPLTTHYIIEPILNLVRFID